MSNGRKRFRDKIGPMFQQPGPDPGSGSLGLLENVPEITSEDFGIKPISGGIIDAPRARVVKGYFTQLPDEVVIYEDITREVIYNNAIGARNLIAEYNVPENRTLVIDNVYFFATPVFGLGLIPAGVVEGSLQCFFDIGKVVPVDISTNRVQPGVPADNRAYFPFLNDRVGTRESTFAFYVKSGREVGAYYINRGLPSVPINTVGVRFEGWIIDSNIFEEILDQQR